MNKDTILQDVFFFKSMLTPKVITVVYWLSLAGITLAGIAAMVAGSFLGGIGMIVAGAIGVRLWCELILVLFKINENVQRIADRG